MERLRDAVDQKHGQTEPIGFDGASVTLAEVFDELRSYSLMTAYKLVVVDEADAFVKTHRSALERYVEEPVDHATLVLRASTWNKGKLDKGIDRVGVLLKCEPLSAREASAWLMDRAESEHRTGLSRDAAEGGGGAGGDIADDPRQRTGEAGADERERGGDAATGGGDAGADQRGEGVGDPGSAAAGDGDEAGWACAGEAA